MRLAGQWTWMMAIAIAALGVTIFARCWGGGAVAWMLAPLGVFVSLQVIGLLIVLPCELAERCGIVPRAWRPHLHDCLLHGALLGIGYQVIGMPWMGWILVYFALMHLLRLLLRRQWAPGEPVQVGGQQ